MAEHNNEFDIEKYGTLWAEYLPQVISTKEEYEKTEMILDSFLSRD